MGNPNHLSGITPEHTENYYSDEKFKIFMELETWLRVRPYSGTNQAVLTFRIRDYHPVSSHFPESSTMSPPSIVTGKQIGRAHV